MKWVYALSGTKLHHSEAKPKIEYDTMLRLETKSQMNWLIFLRFRDDGIFYPRTTACSTGLSTNLPVLIEAEKSPLFKLAQFDWANYRTVHGKSIENSLFLEAVKGPFVYQHNLV